MKLKKWETINSGIFFNFAYQHGKKFEGSPK